MTHIFSGRMDEHAFIPLVCFWASFASTLLHVCSLVNMTLTDDPRPRNSCYVQFAVA